MKNFILFIFTSLASLSLFAQTGPGGVGSSTNIEAWMDASQLGLSNNAAVSSWTDTSGNSNHAEQLTTASQPTFLTNQINGLPAIDFDGVDDFLDFSNNITADAITLFVVNKNTLTDFRAVLGTEDHTLFFRSNRMEAVYFFPTSFTVVNKPLNQFSVFSMQTGANSTSGAISLRSGTNLTNGTRSAYPSRTTSSIGTRYNFSNITNLYHQGQFAEVIIFNEELNSAKRKIVSNHLAAKYNLTAEQNLYSHKTTHGNAVIGIGQESDGSHIESRGNGVVEISNASTLNDGDYLLVGHDEGGLAASVSVGAEATQRWTQVWRADLTGTPGSIDLTFFLGANDFALDPNDYVVLVESADGDFSNGGTSIQETGRVYDGVNGTVSFTGISISDGDYFTLAEKSGVTVPSIDFGPGGVGNTANIEAWMDASQLGLSNNAAVSTWTDVSGNANDAEQLTTSSQPTFLTNQINGLPAIDFDGVDDFLDFSNNITADAITLFVVNKNTLTDFRAVLGTEDHTLFFRSNRMEAVYFFPTSFTVVNKPLNQFSVFSMQTGANSTSGAISLRSGTNLTNGTRSAYPSRTTSSIGTRYNFSNITNLYHQGQFAEVIIFNEELNSAKRKIVSNHLAAKYNLTAEQNLYAHKSIHGHNVIGIGQESDGSHLEARDRDSILINNASAIGDGDYILIGNDDADFSIISTSAGGVIERWNRTWRVDKTGTPGAINVKFFLTDNGFALPSDYVVIIEEDDGDFSNGGTRIIELGSFNSVDSSITFSGIDFADGATFALAEKTRTIESIADTDWSLNSTWNCDCVPTQNDTVNVINDVTISSNQEVFNLSISNGSITFSGSDTLDVYGSLAIGAGGSVSAGNGTIAVTGTSAAAQTLDNTSGSIAALNNLFINSTNGANIESGGWSISNSLQVSSGGLDVTNADSVVLVSNVTSTAQILESMSGAFTGEFIVQRFINSRNANYSNHSSPISDATVADLDDDLILSGVGGVNGNAGPPSNIFRSMYFFDSPTDAYVAITSLTTSLPSGTGYEVYLADTIGSFYGATVDYRGTLFNGDLTSTVIADQGWNLIGNPYQSFIDYTAVSKGTLPNEYYIYNSSTGNYDFFSGTLPNIAPGQGFWVEKTTPGNQFIDFQENDKVDNNSSSFLRTKTNPSFSLGLSSAQTDFSHKMEVNFDVNAISELDELDASYLKSPVKDAPAIYSRATNSDKDLIVNSLNPFEESQLIPIEIYAGLDGAYSIDAENVTELYKDYSCVYLKDKATNEAVDLSVEPSYQFETAKGTSDRFELIVSNSYGECEKLIEDGSFEQKLDHKLELRNGYGQWFLDYTLDDKQQQVEIRILNMAGQEVKETISFGASNAGTYPLQNLQDLNGIYLIQVKTKDGFLNKTVKL